uniref:Uncharacterized protein n=1 Tax=Salix viminalis TaxID=40686 RepID=A0A6N2LP31_SALVM
MRLSTSSNVNKETVHNWRDYHRLHCYPLDKQRQLAGQFGSYPDKPKYLTGTFSHGETSDIRGRSDSGLTYLPITKVLVTVRYRRYNDNKENMSVHILFSSSASSQPWKGIYSIIYSDSAASIILKNGCYFKVMGKPSRFGQTQLKQFFILLDGVRLMTFLYINDCLISVKQHALSATLASFSSLLCILASLKTFHEVVGL